MYQTYKKKTMPDNRKILYDIEHVYEMIKLRNEDDAERSWMKYQKELTDHGISSDYIRTQYFCSFEIKGTRFVTQNRLEDLGVIKESLLTGIDRILEKLPKNPKNIYKIGSIDSARYQDMATFIYGILKVDTTFEIPKYTVTATDFVIINKEERDNGNVISPIRLNEKCFNICKENELDMVIYDTTAQQTDRAYYLHTLLKTRGVNTLIIPYAYSGGNKQRMFEKTEEMIESRDVIIPNTADPDLGYQEFLKQLFYFKKEVLGTRTKYEAPQARGYYDDFVVAFGQLCYLPHYVKKCEDEGVTANLASDADYDIEFSKFYENKEEQQYERITKYKR